MGLICGDARVIPLADGSVHCVVCSPPYFGLRDYGTARWEGGDAACTHKVGRFETPVSDKQRSNSGSGDTQARSVCPKCGARRIDAQIGLEQTPEAYVAGLVAVFREVWRVLRDDGVVWLNVGDSYAGSGGAHADHHANSGLSQSAKRNGVPHWGQLGQPGNYLAPRGLKPKDLMMIPARLALALQADGWWVRAEIVWAKPNPMPESVRDRPTRSHEMIYLLSKSERYYYDADAVREPVKLSCDGTIRARARTANGALGGENKNSFEERVYAEIKGANARDVWTMTTGSFKGAHYATFPEELVRRCVLAGSPLGGIVFDPFVGSGTTVKVALDLGRRGVGVDLKPEYLEMAKRRGPLVMVA